MLDAEKASDGIRHGRTAEETARSYSMAASFVYSNIPHGRRQVLAGGAATDVLEVKLLMFPVAITINVEKI